MSDFRDGRQGQYPRIRETTVAFGLAALLVATGACAGNVPDDAGDVGSVRLQLATVPAGVACVEITAQGTTRAEVVRIGVTPGVPVDRVVGGLPIGRVTISAQAFAVPCAQITPNTVAAWISDPVVVTIAPGQVPSVQLLMKRNGRARIGIGWADEPACLATGAVCTQDAACCSGICAADRCDDAAQGIPNLVFVTSTVHTGDLGGIPGGDAICQARASAAGRSGTFVALLSSANVNGKDRLAGSRGWVRTDGRPFVDRAESLFAPNEHVYYPPNRDEFGQAVPSDAYVMTGTQHTGIVDPDWTCGDWTTQSAGWFGGYAGNGGVGWTDYVGTSCTVPARLICFEIGRVAVVRPTQQIGTRAAFISASGVSIDGGLASADALCTSDAAAAGLPGSFKALVATSTFSAVSRFNLSGPPWARRDGVLVVEAAADLAANGVIAPIDITADGINELSNYGVLAGAPTPGDMGTNTCLDYTSRAPGTFLSYGSSFFTGPLFFGTFTFPCEGTGLGPQHVFCLQE